MILFFISKLFIKLNCSTFVISKIVICQPVNVWFALGLARFLFAYTYFT